MERKGRLILVRCRNTSEHFDEKTGKELIYFFLLIRGADWYEYPPKDFIESVIDNFLEENPEEIISISYGECHFCKAKREDAKEDFNDDIREDDVL